jgi:DNA-binding CsgD family transcriptional regulator
MIDRGTLKSAADELLAAALLDRDWQPGLDQLAEAAGAGGVSVMRFHQGRPCGFLASTEWAKADAELLRGHAPPSPRQFYPDTAFRNGFVTDQDLYTADELRRDPYFQEFLRPRGVFWHAKCRLCDSHGSRISLSLKRAVKFGVYSRDDIAALNSVLPQLQTASQIVRRAVQAETAGMARILELRGNLVFEIDTRGRVRQAHGDARGGATLPIALERLGAVRQAEQASLDRTVMEAVTPPQRPAFFAVQGLDGGRRMLHLVPITGQARDVFRVTAALAILTDPGAPRGNIASGLGVLRQAFGLTHREAQIATLLANGHSLPEIAEKLRLRPGTVRNHLKSTFAKSDTHRQGEFIALVSRLIS